MRGSAEYAQGELIRGVPELIRCNLSLSGSDLSLFGVFGSTEYAQGTQNRLHRIRSSLCGGPELILGFSELIREFMRKVL